MLILSIFANISCTQSEYQRVGGQIQQNPSEQSSEKVASLPEELKEKPTYKVVYRKSNLETLAIGRNRIEIQELMGEPEGKSLDGGNGYLWDYRRPVLDEVTGEIYGWSLVSFKFLKGLCAYVNISLANPPPEILEQKNSSNLFKF
ncbi:MAG: hypothetical protein HN548_06635 [Opitutae bacterium]|nr:hypothetical protein [Opitutae bacterium]MBT5716012.1 hypothetical protein [Opitutae bacterium]